MSSLSSKNLHTRVYLRLYCLQFTRAVLSAVRDWHWGTALGVAAAQKPKLKILISPTPPAPRAPRPSLDIRARKISTRLHSVYFTARRYYYVCSRRGTTTFVRNYSSGHHAAPQHEWHIGIYLPIHAKSLIYAGPANPNTVLRLCECLNEYSVYLACSSSRAVTTSGRYTTMAVMSSL